MPEELMKEVISSDFIMVNAQTQRTPKCGPGGGFVNPVDSESLGDSIRETR